MDSLLKVRDETDIRATGLDEAAQEEIKQLIEKRGGTVKFVGNPTTTLEDLFLQIIAQSEARPGHRVRGGAVDGQ